MTEAGRPVRQIAHDLGISEQTIYAWRRQHLIDTGQLPGPTSEDQAELVVARRRIAEPEAEPALHRRAAWRYRSEPAPLFRLELASLREGGRD